MENERQAEEENEPPPTPCAGLPYRISSDMNLDGRYEESVLELTETELRNICGDTVRLRISLDEVEFVLCTEFVGNGLLQAQLRDGRQIPVIRYSKTLSERFEEVEDEINAILGRELTDDEKEEQRGPEAPAEGKLTYRCPNCGYPLKTQGDVCPKCVKVGSMMWRLVKYLKPYWKEATAGLVLALILTALALMPGLVVRSLIDGPLRLPEVQSEEDIAAARAGGPATLFADDKVRKLAAEQGIDPMVIEGTGQRAVVTKRDVDRYLDERTEFASPAVQKLAHEKLASPKVVKGTGENGAIIAEDVNTYAASTEALPASPATRRWAFHLGVDLHTVKGTGAGGQIRVDDVKEASKPVRYRFVAYLVGILLAVFMVRALLSVVRIYLMGSLGAKLIHDIRSHLYRALQRLSLSFYEREHTGRIMSRVTSDTSVLNTFVVSGFPNMLIYILTILGIGTVMIAFHWKLALLTLLATPLMTLATVLFAGKLRVTYRRIRYKNASVYKVVSEAISGISVVRAFGQEDREIHTFENESNQYREAVVDYVKLISFFSPAMVFLTAMGMLVIYSYGGYLVIRGDIELGMLVMFTTYMVQFYAPVQALTQLTDMFQSTAVSAERVFSILDSPSEVADSDTSVFLPEVKGNVVFENVEFCYEKGERVLRDISLDVKAGEIIGLVGATGSGKSTVVKLLARFYDPTRGRILLDGHDLREIRLRVLRRDIGMVLQETFLFTGTLRENISYGRPDATNDEIIEAARAANAHHFIMDLPDAYDTYVGERGVGLSGGERQRIAIARAILKDPAILILDEATSAVDTATEAMIQEALDRLMEGRTTFAIAHRLSTLKNASRLVVMDGGRVVEMGTHEELLSQKDGIYRNLVEIQDLLSDAPAARKQSVA